MTSSPRKLTRDLEDKALMQNLQAGDVNVLGILFERYSRLVLSVALRVLRDDAEAQDLLQDVFLYVLRRNSVFDPGRGTVVSWMFQVALSKASNRRDRSRLRHRITGPLTYEIDRVANLGTQPDKLISELSAHRVVHMALVDLKPRERETLWLHFFDGYSLREISVKRNENLGNTRHHYYRGIQNLRRSITAKEQGQLSQRESSLSASAARGFVTA